MARNQNTTRNSNGMCKKICNAFSITPFKAKIHRISHHSGSNSSHRPIPQPQMTKHSNDRPVPHDHAVRRDILIVNGDHHNGQKPALKTKSSKNDDDDGKKKKKVEESKSNEKFTDYIRKVKDKMRTLSSVSSNVGAAARTTTRRDSFNDKVMNYIDRAKIKIRTTTSVGDENGVSLK